MEPNVHIRQATPNDTAGIATVKQLTWPDEEVDVAHIAQAIADDRHVTHVAVHDTTIIGFVDGFTTQNRSLRLRWEVDLLAVHPDYRSYRCGTRLVRIATQTGYQRGATLIRGLIRVDNTASQRTFAHCSYHQDQQVRTLYVALPGCQETAVRTFARAWKAIPVTSLTYTGWWLEIPEDDHDGDSEPCAFDLEREVVGVVLASEDKRHHHAAQAAGFTAIGQFHFWYHVQAGHV